MAIKTASIQASLTALVAGACANGILEARNKEWILSVQCPVFSMNGDNDRWNH